MDRLGIPVELAWHERADHQVVRLKRLMDRRRHMETTRARLEVVDVERHRVDRPVPSDDVEWMVIEHIPAHVIRALEPDLGGSVNRRLERIGSVEIALAEGCKLGE